MSIGEAVQKGIILLVIVFIVLFILYAGIIIFGKLLGNLGKKPGDSASEKDAAPIPSNENATILPASGSEMDFQTYAGTLRLRNVDEQTAAMVMAVVSDESGIPLSELQFTSISLVETTKAKEDMV